MAEHIRGVHMNIPYDISYARTSHRTELVITLNPDCLPGMPYEHRTIHGISESEWQRIKRAYGQAELPQINKELGY